MPSLETLIEWIHAHPHLGVALSGFVTFLESLALIGSIVPGSVFMTAMGILIGSHALPAVPTLLAAMLGAFVGDVLSFGLGYRYHASIRQAWPFSKHPHWLEKGEHFLTEHGKASVFIARFLGPIRSIVPLVAGMMRMRVSVFCITDFFSAVLWAPAYMLPGVFVGLASHQLTPKKAALLLGILLLSLFALYLSWWLIKKLCLKFIRRINRTLLKQNLSWQGVASLRFFWLSALCLGCGLGFAALAYAVKTHTGIWQWNEPVYYVLRSVHFDWLYQLSIFLTFLGDKKVLFPVMALLGLYFLYVKDFKSFRFWVLTQGGVIVAVFVLKGFLAVPRPTGLIVSPKGYGFPSGHSALAMSFWAGFSILLWHRVKRVYRSILLRFVTALVTLVLFSRVYLGVHWLTDVLGGGLCAAALLAGVTLKTHFQKRPPGQLKGLLGVFALSLCVSFGMAYSKHASLYQKGYRRHWQTHWVQKADWLSGKTQFCMRKNRWGRPIEPVTLEYAGSLQTLADHLESEGWQTAPEKTLETTLLHLTEWEKPHLLPLWSEVLDDKPPALVLFQKENHAQLTWVLRLWKSTLRFQNTKEPIYLGTLKQAAGNVPSCQKLQHFAMSFRENFITHLDCLSHDQKRLRVFKTL